MASRQELEELIERLVKEKSGELLAAADTGLQVAEKTVAAAIIKYPADLTSWLESSTTIVERPGRLKTTDSIFRKITSQFGHDSAMWSNLDQNRDQDAVPIILENLDDIVGCEIAGCTNQFVDDLVEAIPKQISRIAGHEYPNIKDYRTNSQPDGYRSVNVNFKVGQVWVEVQLKTHLEKSWERLSHDLIYKASSPSERLQEMSKELADLYSICGSFGDRLVQEIVQSRERGTILNR